MVKQYKLGRSATYLARSQKISRQMVYKLAYGYDKGISEFEHRTVLLNPPDYEVGGFNRN